MLLMSHVKDVRDVKYLNKDQRICNYYHVEDVKYNVKHVDLCQRCQKRLKIHKNMFLLITFLIFIKLLIQKKFWKAET